MRNSSLFLGAALSLCVVVPASQVRSAPASGVPGRAPYRSWVVLTAATDQAHYSPGQPINVRLTVRNGHKSGAFLRFSSGQRFDFAIYRAGQSEPAYTWSASRMFIQSLGSLWLKPGQSQDFEATIGDEMGQLKPGKYRLLARLTNSPRSIVAAAVGFEVTNVGLAMTARTDKKTYKIGESVQIDVAVSNRKPGVNRVHFNSGLGCDVIVSDEAGNAIWSYGANLRFIRVLGEVTWNKGETKKYAASWNGVALPGENSATQIKPGTYRVQAVLQSTPLVYAPPVTIEIVE